MCGVLCSFIMAPSENCGINTRPFPWDIGFNLCGRRYLADLITGHSSLSYKYKDITLWGKGIIPL